MNERVAAAADISHHIIRMVSQLATNCHNHYQTTAPSLLLRLRPSFWNLTITSTWAQFIVRHVVVYSDPMSCLQTIEGEDTENNFYWPYHEPSLVIEWQKHVCQSLPDAEPLWHWRKIKCGPPSKEDPWPWPRPTGKGPRCRFGATGQLLYWAIGPNQVGCSCT